MGAKIKPSFISEFQKVSEGWHLFRIGEVKVDLIAPEDQKDKDGVKNDKNFVVQCAVEGGEEDGIGLQEFFANHSKKEFGLSRLAGLMVKTGAIEPIDEIDVDTMRTEKFESKFKMALPKRLFGGRVRHIIVPKNRPGETKGITDDGQKKEGPEEHNIFANIVEYASQKEYNDIATRKIKEPDKGTKVTEVPGTPSSQTKDPWA